MQPLPKCPAINNLCYESPSHAGSSCQRYLPVSYTVLLRASIFVIASPIRHFLGLPCFPLPSEFHSWHNLLSFIVVFSKSAHLRCLDRQHLFPGTFGWIYRYVWISLTERYETFKHVSTPCVTCGSVSLGLSMPGWLILPPGTDSALGVLVFSSTYCACCVTFALDMIWLLSGAVCLLCRDWWLQQGCQVWLQRLTPELLYTASDVQE